VSGQLSFFSAGARPPAYADLEGLLAGPGQVVRRGGLARISVLIRPPARWRVVALAAELAALGLGAEVAAAGTRDGTAVRTPFVAELLPLAQRWTAGAAKRPPAGFDLDGPRLRWWCLAAGRTEPAGYRLGLDQAAEQSWSAVGAALAAAGVPGTLVGPRADGPAYRIVGSRRLGRLRELVGDPPPEAPAVEWPIGPGRAQPAPGRG
jgi:hypothetical protein